MTLPLTMLASLAALAATACSIPPTVVGAVTALPADCGPDTQAAASGAALPGATVAARCPGNSAPAISVTTDAKGLLRRELEHPLPLACEIVVSKDGYEPRTYPMKDVCAQTEQERSCLVVSLSARLVARRTAKGAP